MEERISSRRKSMFEWLFEAWSGNGWVFLSCSFKKNPKKKHLSQAQFVSRFAIVIPCVVYHWKILNWLLHSLTFTNILASIDAPRGCPNSHNSTKNDSKRKENVVKGSRGLLTAQNSLKVLRIESIVPRFS